MSIEIKDETKCGCGGHGNPAWGHNRAEGQTAGESSYCATRPGQWIRVVRDFVKLLKFGEVHLTVHKGRVIEVRKVEKVRFEET